MVILHLFFVLLGAHALRLGIKLNRSYSTQSAQCDGLSIDTAMNDLHGGRNGPSPLVSLHYNGAGSKMGRRGRFATMSNLTMQTGGVNSPCCHQLRPTMCSQWLSTCCLKSTLQRQRRFLANAGQPSQFRIRRELKKCEVLKGGWRGAEVHKARC